MQYTLKTLVAAAIIASAGVAHADVTVATGGTFELGGSTYKLEPGTGTLSFSKSLIDALNTGQVKVTAVDPAVSNSTTHFDPDFEVDVYDTISASAPVTSVTASDAGEVLNVTTAGGALQVAPKLAGISLGGNISVTNLAVDLTNKAIYATLKGNFTGVANGTAGSANGAVTTVDNFHLWNYASISGPTTVTGAGTFNNTISGLSITSEGLKYFISSLRLVTSGVDTLSRVTDYGTITSTLNVSAVPSVPEPSTYAMALAGLAVAGLAARRARKA